MSEARKPTGARVALRAGVALAIFLAIGFGLSVADEQNRYLWVKALHVIAVISWMAGMLYMPRLFIDHLDHEIGSAASETFKVMERRLISIIMTPAIALFFPRRLSLPVTHMYVPKVAAGGEECSETNKRTSSELSRHTGCALSA